MFYTKSLKQYRILYYLMVGLYTLNHAPFFMFGSYHFLTASTYDCGRFVFNPLPPREHEHELNIIRNDNMLFAWHLYFV